MIKVNRKNKRITNLNLHSMGARTEDTDQCSWVPGGTGPNRANRFQKRSQEPQRERDKLPCRVNVSLFILNFYRMALGLAKSEYSHYLIRSIKTSKNAAQS